LIGGDVRCRLRTLSELLRVIPCSFE